MFPDITTEALLMAMPFENYVQVYDLKGKYLLEALEFSVGVTQTNPTSFYSGRMLQIGGICLHNLCNIFLVTFIKNPIKSMSTSSTSVLHFS